MADFNKAIDKVLVNEGGYVNNPNDAGGETKFGISKRSYPDVDIKNLTQLDAKMIYKRDYWDKVKADEIKSDAIAYELFDTAVNMGVRTASKLMQGCVGAFIDGYIGKQTLQLINSIDEEKILLRFKLSKVARYVSLVKKRPKNKKFLVGWLNRTLGA